jgi:hypothetical protein
MGRDWFDVKATSANAFTATALLQARGRNAPCATYSIVVGDASRQMARGHVGQHSRNWIFLNRGERPVAPA